MFCENSKKLSNLVKIIMFQMLPNLIWHAISGVIGYIQIPLFYKQKLRILDTFTCVNSLRFLALKEEKCHFTYCYSIITLITNYIFQFIELYIIF